MPKPNNFIWVSLSVLALSLSLGVTAVHADPVNFLTPGPVTGSYGNHENLPFPANVPPPPPPPFGPNCTQPGSCVQSGIINLTAIAPGWTAGVSDGTEVNGYFTNLVLTSGPLPSFTYTGGNLAFYNVPFGTYNPAGGTVPTPDPAGAAAFAAGGFAPFICPGGTCPAPWLTLDFVPGVLAPGDTTTTVAGTFPGVGTGYLSVTGGSAAGLFDTNSFILPGELPPADFLFTNLLVPCLTDEGSCPWPLLSQGQVQGIFAPEPSSLLLLAAGMAGLGLWRVMRSA